MFEINNFIHLFELVAPEFLKEELKKHEAEVSSKSKFKEAELKKVFELLQKNINFVSSSSFSKFLSKAKKDFST